MLLYILPCDIFIAYWHHFQQNHHFRDHHNHHFHYHIHKNYNNDSVIIINVVASYLWGTGLIYLRSSNIEFYTRHAILEKPRFHVDQTGSLCKCGNLC